MERNMDNDAVKEQLLQRTQALTQNKAFIEGFEELIDICYTTASLKGWWNPPKTIGEQIALYHSEISEALEEIRTGHQPYETYVNNNKPEGFPIELADCIIRMLDTTGHYDIKLLGAILWKMNYNLTREHRHGGKVL